jgi:hypothetical protein
VGLPNLLDKLEAVDIRHAIIGDQQVNGAVGQFLESGLTRTGNGDGITAFRIKALQLFADDGIGVDE